MPGRIQDSLELILATYAEARATESFGSGSELWDVFTDLKEALSTCPSVRRRPDLRVTWSAGKGNWAKVPWVTVLDERETRTTQGGVYCVYLFRQDMSGVYLTFNQGVTEPKNDFGRTKAHEVLRAKAAEVRGLCKGLGERSFRLDDGIDLRAERGLGVDYESSTIAHKLYEADRVPDDEILLGDLEALLGVYDRYLADDKWREALDLCRAYLGDRGSFDARETEYKLRIVDAIREALDPEQAAEGFGQRLRSAFTNSDNNLTNWQAHDLFTRWAIDEQERAREAVRALVSEDKSVEECVDGFLQRVPDEAVSGLGTRISIASYRVRLWDTGTRIPPYR
jgi:hypothetical protein